MTPKATDRRRWADALRRLGERCRRTSVYGVLVWYDAAEVLGVPPKEVWRLLGLRDEPTYVSVADVRHLIRRQLGKSR